MENEALNSGRSNKNGSAVWKIVCVILGVIIVILVAFILWQSIWARIGKTPETNNQANTTNMNSSNKQVFRYDNIEIGKPSGWKDATTVILAGAPNGGYSPSITITREQLPVAINASEYATQQLPLLEKAFSSMGYKMINEGPFTAGKNINAYQRTHKIADENNMEIEQWQVYVTDGQEAIVITCTDKASTFDSTMPVFQQALSQFSFVEN